jgi:two-component system chemotaxis response regulator CheB
MPGHDIIVIGTSAGGVEALTTVVRPLPGDLPAAVFVVLHIPAEGPSLLAHILNHNGSLHAVQAEEGMAIKYGHIYVAKPDHHLMVERGKVRVVRGPRENRHRPAVDPLFRSAALVYGPRVAGVILTGALDDGTAGLLAVKRRGGLAVVQDPQEALYPSMPTSALAHVEVDYTLPLTDIGPLLIKLAYEQIEEEIANPGSKDMEIETNLEEMDMNTFNDERAGKPSAFSCPECGGVLWELEDGNLLRFRCRVGHAFSLESLQAEQSRAVEEALWTALKTLEESMSLSQRMERQAHTHGRDWLAQRFEVKRHEAEHHAHQIRKLLLRGEKDVLPDTQQHLANIENNKGRG